MMVAAEFVLFAGGGGFRRAHSKSSPRILVMSSLNHGNLVMTPPIDLISEEMQTRGFKCSFEPNIGGFSTSSHKLPIRDSQRILQEIR